MTQKFPFLCSPMAKTSAAASSQSRPLATVSESVSPESVTLVQRLFKRVGVSDFIPEIKQSKDFYSVILRNLLKAASVQRGRISCFFSADPAIVNFYGGLHGGAVAAIAEKVGYACTRTVVAEDKEIFLGELSLSYLSSAQQNEILEVDGSVLRSGRNITAVALEFKIKKSGKLVYTARATFYHSPNAKL